MMNKYLFAVVLGLSLLGVSQRLNAQQITTAGKKVNVKALMAQQKTLEENKILVLNFYQEMFGDKDISAVDRYILPTYIQHNPHVADGADAFKKAAAIWFKGAPKTKIDVQQIAAEGDLVFIHIKTRNPDDSYTSTIDIFRIQNGKIAEHWDVHEKVPEHAANAHPMF